MHNLSCENEFYLHENEKLLPYQRLSTYPRFETDARGNSEMAYYILRLFKGLILTQFLRNLVTANERSDSVPKTVPRCTSTQHRPSLTHKLKMFNYVKRTSTVVPLDRDFAKKEVREVWDLQRIVTVH